MAIKLDDTLEIETDNFPNVSTKKFKSWLSQLSLVLSEEFDISTISELFEELQTLKGDDLIELYSSDFSIEEAVEDLMLSRKYQGSSDRQTWNNII